MFGASGCNLGSGTCDLGNSGATIKGSDGLDYQRLGGVHVRANQG